jgi:hypothetical protein
MRQQWPSPASSRMCLRPTLPTSYEKYAQAEQVITAHNTT